MSAILTGQGEQTPVIEKFVITGFADVHRPGWVTCYAEVCARASETFVLLLPTDSKLESQHALYFDDQTCSRFLSEFEQIETNTGRHRQRVGDEVFDVTPTEATIASVSSPTGHDGDAFRVAFSADEDPDRVLGTWLVWSHPVPERITGRASAEYLVTLGTRAATISHFYLFLVLPVGHEAVNPECILGSTRMIGGERPTNPVHMFTLEPPFPVFPDWHDWIYGRQILRTRDDVKLEADQEATLQLATRSEALQGRVSTRAYATGLSFAISTNLLASALFSIDDGGWRVFPVVALVVGAVGSGASGLIGWHAVRGG